MARLLFFGKLADLAGVRVRDFALSTEIATVKSLIDQVANANAPLGSALKEPATRFVVNEEFVTVTKIIEDGDEIAFLPPVSGG